MQKFGIEVTKGNTETVIDTFDNKEDAMAFGNAYFAALKKGDGIVTCFEADFDEHDQKVGNSEKVHHVWY